MVRSMTPARGVSRRSGAGAGEGEGGVVTSQCIAPPSARVRASGRAGVSSNGSIDDSLLCIVVHAGVGEGYNVTLYLLC